MDPEIVIESLSPHERKVLPVLKEKNLALICKKTNLDKVSVLRALEYLSNKGIIELVTKQKKVVELDANGALYKKIGLPERRLLRTIEQTKQLLSLEDAQKTSKLSENEFRAALGALKKKAQIDLRKGKVILQATPHEITKKTLEEIFLEQLPLEFETLSPEQKYALQSLQSRKQIVMIAEQKIIQITITKFGEKIIDATQDENEQFIEQITPQMIISESWKGKKFRRYDVQSPVPSIAGGKRHFVNQTLDYVRKIWTDLGFEEMQGTMITSSFWNFDALFTPQDHPAREMQDTFFLDHKEALPSGKVVKEVKNAHEKGVDKSEGWKYDWAEEEAKKLVLRTHTTCLSAQTLASLDIKKDLPKKYFAVGKCFRNETIDWSHGFEFYQTEGIVIDKNVNLRHLLGYLQIFYQKMGFAQVRFRPSYFAYTEPSVEIEAWHSGKKKWIELGGAGMLRPEVVIPLLGEHVPVLAWGQGVDRMIMDAFAIKDLRELYKNDIDQLRKIPFWMK